jgi:lysozyme family protein
MQSSMTQQFVRQRACGLQMLQHAAPASYKAGPFHRATCARSIKTAQQQVQEQQQEQHLQEQQPKAVALQVPSKATHALVAALPQPVQRGLGAAATALEPARQAVSGLVGKIDPRVRGLILLNAMTLLMGSNWVVVKGANDAWDPVSTAARW